MPVDATVETYGDLTGEGSVLVDFWGPRCQPCPRDDADNCQARRGGRRRSARRQGQLDREPRDLPGAAVFGLPTYVLMRDGRSSSASQATYPRTTSSGPCHARRGGGEAA